MIGNGVVVDPSALLTEMETLRGQGATITPETFVVSESVTLILPIHQMVDHAREAIRGADKIGTTGRGIGPAYEDKVARRAVRLADLADSDALMGKLQALTDFHNIFLKAAGVEQADAADMHKALMAMAENCLPIQVAAGRCLVMQRHKASVSCLRVRKASCLILTMAPIRL